MSRDQCQEFLCNLPLLLALGFQKLLIRIVETWSWRWELAAMAQTQTNRHNCAESWSLKPTKRMGRLRQLRSGVQPHCHLERCHVKIYRCWLSFSYTQFNEAAGFYEYGRNCGM
jgi:hypothetical protein